MPSTEVLMGTSRGVASLDADRPLAPAVDVRDITRGSVGWWLVDRDGGVWSHPDHEDGSMVAQHSDHALHCILEFESADSDVLIGGSDATLFTRAEDRLTVDETFLLAGGRPDWYTPWGGPPDVRSMSAGPDGVPYVNVHVGGILRRDEQGWTPTLDMDADVHQVVAHPVRPGTVVAATAWGLAISRNAGATWTFESTGLHASYCRAVALAGDLVFVSASTGSRGHHAAVYRGNLDDPRMERCTKGLPDWFGDNIDTKCIGTNGDVVYVAESAGVVHRSFDEGSSWEVARSGLPQINAIDVHARSGVG